MYEIFPKSLREFVEDSSIKLPRFQRKASWDPKKRFELALSIFKNYPLGASILSREADDNKNLTEWLLDGRQRRDTMKDIYESPDCLYVWGKKYLPIKKGDNLATINETFWNKVADFIEEEKPDDPSKVQKDSGLEEKGEQGASDTNSDEKSLNNIENNETETSDGSRIQANDLNNSDEEQLGTLLTLLNISFSYCKDKDISGLTYSFDFKDYLSGKAFFGDLYSDDKRHVNCAKLREFLRKYKSINIDKYSNLNVFIEYLDQRYNWKDDSSKAKLTSFLTSSWKDQQLKIIDCFDSIDKMFLSRKIAIIETHDITPTDSQKIFNLINTGGTKLTASEILSAKPKWNKEIKAPGTILSNSIEKLYDNLELGNVSAEKTVIWDIPAACTYFFDKEGDESGFDLFFSLSDDDVANRITIGFKLMSGFFTDGVKKDNIDNLSKVIDWNNYEDSVMKIKSFFDSFIHNPYLSVIKSWGKCLSDVLSDGPTMNLLFLLYRSWKELGEPTGFSSKEREIFDKNVFIQLDNSFYGYLSNQWKGSSDSTISRNIVDFNNRIGRDSSGLFIAMPEDSWKTLLSTLFSKNLLNGKLISKGSLAPLIYYYNCLKGLKGVGFSQPGEIDHIIPQSAWFKVSLDDKDAIQNNAFNLALLPKDANASKNNDTLAGISSNQTIASTCEEYEEIKINDFGKYSSTSSYLDLKNYREKLYMDAFTTKRNQILKS